jgi:hypothetical protein
MLAQIVRVRQIPQFEPELAVETYLKKGHHFDQKHALCDLAAILQNPSSIPIQCNFRHQMLRSIGLRQPRKVIVTFPKPGLGACFVS